MELYVMQEELKKLVSLSSWYITIQLLTLCVFIGGAALLYLDLQELKSAASANGGTAGPPRMVDDWDEYIRSHDASQGPDDAKVTLVEFTDFQCPYCKTFTDGTRNELRAKYGDKVRFVLKHVPLEQSHPDAKRAAIAAQCALREGKFWEIHDAFFRNPKDLSEASIIEKGRSLGLGNEFGTCVAREETIAEVAQDVKDASALGVRGTPSFLINGKLQMGMISASQFESIVGDLLN
jgi:protein-disulfide isomerase